MRSVILFVIVAFLSASYAEETTVEPTIEKTTDARPLADEPLITTLLAKTTIPTTIATSPAPTTTTTPRPTTTTPVPTTVQRRVTTPTPVSTTTTTTSAPSRSRSRSRVLKTQESDEAYRQLIPIKVLQTGNSESQLRERDVASAEPKQINIIRSEPAPSLRRSQPTSTPSTTESVKVSEKADKSQRRGKVHYPTGKELGLDNPALNYQSKYELDKYKFSYETKDGQTRAENGIFENMGTDDQNYVVKGSYSYFDADGIEFIVNYTADRKGYHPVITVNNPHRGQNVV